MKKYIIFEDCVGRRLESRLYYYCLQRQLSLIKYLPLYILCGFLRFFGAGGRKKYLECRYSFLASVNGKSIRIKDFFTRYKKKFFLPDECLTVLSDAPAEVMSAFGLITGTEAVGNGYDAASGRFTEYCRAKDMVDEIEYEALGTVLSPIMKNASRKTFIYSKKKFKTRWGCTLALLLHHVLTYLFMLAVSVATGLASLYWAAKAFSDSEMLFNSYFDIPLTVILNILPVVVLTLFAYLLLNSAAAAVFISSSVTMLLTWVNYFKLLFRNDPFLFTDFENVMEAQNMSEHYKIVLSRGMISVIILITAATVFAAIFMRCRVRSLPVRVLALAAVAVASLSVVTNVYYSSDIYAGTENPKIENIWSDTWNFQFRGFVYPFIRSIRGAAKHAPDGYSKKEAEALLNSYTEFDIPEDRRVNVIGVMLEAYSDLGRFDCIEFARDPYEKFREVCDEAYSGNLIVDIFAGGTIQTERTFITGCNTLDTFRKPSNSYAWYYQSQGYTVEGSHPSYDWFYNRVNVNRNLGFGNYYFDDDTYMALNGGYRVCDNRILLPNVVKLMNESLDRGEDYFSFSVTYEGHGPYNSESEYFSECYVPQNELSDESYRILNNYFLTVESVSESIYNMTEELKACSEPVILIMFGDHMPWMGNNNSVYTELGIDFDISTDEGFFNYYETPYFIWANDAAKKTLECDFIGDGPTIGSYFLMNEFFSLAGYGGSRYSQFTSEIHDSFNVIHSTGICIDADGNICRKLTEEQTEKVKLYRKVQYYYLDNFAY